MQAEIDAFHKKIRARALLIAVEWAGSADKLARMVGHQRDAGASWLKRGHIPPLSALSLSLISGFPLTFGEMCPAQDVQAATAQKRCPHCMAYINAPNTRAGCLPILKRRSEAAARKLGASDAVAARFHKRQAQRAKRAAKPKP